MTLQNNNILVTGGAGFIGSHTCKALAQAGYNPVVYDNLEHGHEWAVKWGPLVRGDIQDLQLLRQTLVDYAPVAVVHFAAYAYVGESVIDPAKYYLNNVFGTLNLLTAMREAGTKHLVFSSSCATYGTPDVVPITEQTVQAPVNPYGTTKLQCERMIADHCAAYGISGVALRYFNAAGADTDGELGEDHDPETHLIPLVMQAAAGKGPSVTIFGDDYDTPDGTCIRDYVHVTDLAAAHVAAIRRVGSWDAFNLGTGHGASVKEIIGAVERATGCSVPTTIGSRRPGDPKVLIADPRKARQRLGWSAQHSDLETIVRDAWAWMMRGDSAVAGPLR